MIPAELPIGIKVQIASTELYGIVVSDPYVFESTGMLCVDIQMPPGMLSETYPYRIGRLRLQSKS